MSTEPQYIVLDQLTMNQLGEFDTFEEALDCYRDFVVPHPPAAEHIEIWLDDTRLEIDPTSPPATAA